jgi:hypothetical protein
MALVELERPDPERPPSVPARATRKLSDVARALLEPEPAIEWSPEEEGDFRDWEEDEADLPQWGESSADTASGAGSDGGEEKLSDAGDALRSAAPESIARSEPSAATPQRPRPGPSSTAPPAGAPAPQSTPAPRPRRPVLEQGADPAPSRAAAVARGEPAPQAELGPAAMQTATVEHGRWSESTGSAEQPSELSPSGQAGPRGDTFGYAVVEHFRREDRRSVEPDSEDAEEDEPELDPYGDEADAAGSDGVDDEAASEGLVSDYTSAGYDYGPGIAAPEYGGYELEEQYDDYEDSEEEDNVGGAYDDDDDDAYVLDPERSPIEDPSRRRFFRHGAHEDRHHPRRQRDRNPPRNTMSRYASRAVTAFVGLALVMMLLVTIAIIGGGAAIIKQDQSQTSNPRNIPIPLPAPHPKKHTGHPGSPPIQVPVPVVPPIVPVIPPVVPPAVPPLGPPPVVVPPPARKPPARRTGPTRPPARRKGPTRPPNRRPARPPSQPKPLPMCKNVKVRMPDGGLLPIEIVDAPLDPAHLGVPGICVPDDGNGMGGLTSKDTGPGSSQQVTLDAKVAPSAVSSSAVKGSSSQGAATSRSPTTATLTAFTASASAAAANSHGLLTSDQELFGARLAADTGLDQQVVAAWMLAEESGGAAQARQQANNNDWLNIGYTDSGTFGANDAIWSNPITAADATAGWLEGKDTIPGYGIASAGVRAILNAVRMPQAGCDPEPACAEIAALQNSGWAGSGYTDLPLLYAEVTGIRLPSVSATLTSDMSGASGTLTKAELISKLPTVTPAEMAGLTTQDLENALPQVVSALNGNSVSTMSLTVPGAPGVGPAGAQRMLAAARLVLGGVYNQVNHDDISETPGQVRQQGTDCSGFISYLMGPNGADLWTQSYTTDTMSAAPNLVPGTGTAGHSVTIYNDPNPGNAGHVFIDILGYWFESAGGGTGIHQMNIPPSNLSEVDRYIAGGQYSQIFHPKGM